MKFLASMTRSPKSVARIIFVLIVLLSLVACCADHSEDTEVSLKAALAQNGMGQGVAAWEQPGLDGIAIVRFDAAGIWASTRRIGSSDNPVSVTEITQPTVAGNGDQFILWRSLIDFSGLNTQFHLSRYTAASDTWDNIALPAGATSNPVIALSAQIAADNTGNAWLLWVDGNAATDFGQIWVAHFDAATSTWDSISRLDNGTDTGQSASIAVNGPGVVITSWNAATGNGLWSSRYIAGAWEMQVQVAGGLSGISKSQRIAIDDAGNALMAWRREISNSLSEVYAASFNSGTGIWSASTKLDVDSFAIGKMPKVSMWGTAGYVAWTENSRLWATRSLAGSGTFDSPVSLASSAGSFSLVAVADGRAYLGWYDIGSGTIQVQTYLPMATGWNALVALPANFDGVTGLLAASADDAGNFVILWQRYDDRNHPDPSMCSIEYTQVWTSNYDVATDSWKQPILLDTKRTN